MSIIEKAVSKLEKKNKAQAQAQDVSASAVEQVLKHALNKQDEGGSAAIPSTPADNIPPA